MVVPPASVLSGRASERQVLDRLIETVRGGQSDVLVIRGEAGIGKRPVPQLRGGFRSGHAGLLRATGVESEMELAYASLHQLCAPLMNS